MVPPIISTNNFVMARPNPVPSVVVFLSTSNRSNLLNNFVIFSALIPRPVSCTEIINKHLSSLFTHFTFKIISPLSVYFIALVNKLLIISLTCVLSPINSSGKSSAISILKSIGFSPILVAVILAILVISSLKLYGFSIISIFSLSILLISKIFPTISNSV